ncbi:S8 family serine peptidase [Wenzhouxiangella sp. XN79A]|uniref:S8 family serine peptidase n=1 Tax=Wenzhouxiangella sp. XN79A TaxID=2724193 RepID=UPI00144AF8BC|nr:S8 family serine peptidase [Wenzhouxiangella sp. XN79A]NKI36548.1 S8 family serine peptidase [Wenzhouxiangella sp. XN79A]
MSNFTNSVAALCGAIGLAFAGSALAEDDRWIVHFNPGQSSAGIAAAQNAGGQLKRDLTPAGINAVAIEIPEAALNGLRNNPNVAFIEEDVRRYPMAESVPFGIPMVQAGAGGLQPGNGKRTVCIIDSGYHIDHEDLQTAGVTGDGAGNPFIDSCGHGTHVAGTVAALGGNGTGVVGVVGDGSLDLHIVKVFGDDNWTSGSCGYSYSSDIAAAANLCAQAGADVINMSLGGGAPTSAEEQAFQNLLDANILSIAAAGNDGNSTSSYPASYPAVMSVAAIDSTRTVASFSQYNPSVEIAAPGVDTVSTVPNIGAIVDVAGTTFSVLPIDRTAITTVTGPLATNGGLCDGTDSAWSGQVVLCERGAISFSDKVNNVEASGGIAAIIYNNVAGGFGALVECNGPSWRACNSIPAVTMSQADGQSLLDSAGASTTVSTQSTAPANGYESYNGTSMATPHVAGVAALVWTHNTSWTAAQIRDALTATAEDLGAPGRDDFYGFGLVQAQAALDFLTGGGGGGGGGGNTAPTATFTFSCAELSCSFDGTGSSDADGDALSYSWSFGDGGSATGATVGHSYAGDGAYTVTLTVSDGTDSDAASQTVTVSASVGNTAPMASFTADCTELSCSFDGSGSSDADGDALSYSWTFGDGSSATGATANHTYGADGSYTVTLTVSDGTDTGTDSQTVTVQAATGGGVTLDATGYKVRGRWHADLTWSGATSSSVDIYRDGSLLSSTANDGAFTDATSFNGGGSLTYQVCEAGSNVCSSSVTVVF